MKLVNHQDKNCYDIETYVMRGTISMTMKEYEALELELYKRYKKALKKIDTYTRDALSQTLEGIKENRENMKIGRLVSFGVCATKLLVDIFGLKGYKEQNYGIKIIS